MAIVHDVPREQSWVASVLTTDFCPWANRFVYWLKEPVGWFLIAICFSVLVGLYISPIGWSIASALGVLTFAGMIWPALAVYCTDCRMVPVRSRGSEGDPSELKVVVRNRLPIPVWGLAIEGYLDTLGEEEDVKPPTVTFAAVPPLSTAEYVLPVTPRLRGQYPLKEPLAACAFPFGIWTARRSLSEVRPLLVWPRRYSVRALLTPLGLLRSELGEGTRSGPTGDFIGLRPYRRGDSAKQIHWIASARLDSLVVTERGGPQRPVVHVFVDTRGGDSEELAQRIRTAASILEHLQQSHVAVRLRIGDKDVPFRSAENAQAEWLDALAKVPHEGQPCGAPAAVRSSGLTLNITSGASGCTLVEYFEFADSRRRRGRERRWEVDSGSNLALRLMDITTEMSHVATVA